MKTVLNLIYKITQLLLDPVNSILLLLLIALTIFLVRKYRKKPNPHKIFSKLGMVSLFYIILVGCGILGKYPCHYLQKEYSVWQYNPVEAKKYKGIILLGGGLLSAYDHIQPGLFAYSRIAQAAALYQQARRDSIPYFILISGGDPTHKGISEAQCYANLLQQMGIPPNDIILETKSNNTYENALYTKALLQGNPGASYLLVTSGIHMKRSITFFNNVGLSVQPVPADYIKISLGFIPNSANFSYTAQTLHELLGLTLFPVYNFLGLNKK